MKVVKVDEAMRQQLASLGEEAILLDANGRVLAHVVTGKRAKARLHEYAGTLFDLAEGELVAATENGTGYSFEEVKAHLKSLEVCGCVPVSGQ